MADLSQVLGWQFSLGLVVGLAFGVFFTYRAAVGAMRDAVPQGYRGRAAGTGRIIPPQGGSGTAKYRSFVDDNGRTCLLPNGWSSDFAPPSAPEQP